MQNPINHTSTDIQGILFEKYYSTEEFSDVTSSHWKKFGKKTKVIRGKNSFEISAYGISAFQKKTSFLQSLRHVPINLLLSQMLSQHDAEQQIIISAKSITKSLNIHFDFDHAKHILIFDLLNSYGLFNTEHLICIIGDGHGFFGTLINTLCPDTRILFVILGRNLLIDAICYSEVFPESEPLLFQRHEHRLQLEDKSAIFLEAEHFEWMQNFTISLFINVASMQEMDLPIINRYFEYMRTSSASPHFYCCNREEKTLPDGSVTRFADYPWGKEDILLDELCPWYQEYPYTQLPFWRPFDGPTRHRLVKLQAITKSHSNKVVPKL